MGQRTGQLENSSIGAIAVVLSVAEPLGRD